jgi:hypothetical protein
MHRKHESTIGSNAWPFIRQAAISGETKRNPMSADGRAVMPICDALARRAALGFVFLMCQRKCPGATLFKTHSCFPDDGLT